MNPTNPPKPGTTAAVLVEFLKRVGIITGAALGVVLVVALVLGQFHGLGLSNLLFWAALVVLGIAVVPALSELGSGVSNLRRSLSKQDESPQKTLAERLVQRDKWLNTSVLFGTAGIVIFFLSFVVASLFTPY